MSQVLIDEDENNWNVKLLIKDGKLFAQNESDPTAELYEINLNRDRINIQLKRRIK